MRLREGILYVFKAVIEEYEKITGDQYRTPTPASTKSKGMSFLVSCADFSDLSGSPIYNLNLFSQLTDIADITITSPRIGGDITDMAVRAGIKVVTHKDIIDQSNSLHFDLLVLNQPVSELFLSKFPLTPAVNIVHSPRVEDYPISNSSQVRKYFYAKEEDRKFLVDKVPNEKIAYLPIPVDLQKFSPTYATKSAKSKIVSVSTIDTFRKNMFLSLIDRASDTQEVVIVGKDFGGLQDVPIPKNVTVIYETSLDVRKYIHDATEVAGMYEGTITLEAMAMRKKCSIYEPDGTFTIVKPKKMDRHDARDVAQKFMEEISRKEIDIIIPHHDRSDLLRECLSKIPSLGTNVIVVRGKTFAENCNKGAKITETDKLLFLNDDIFITPDVVWDLIDNKVDDIIGVPQELPTGEALCVGIYINKDGWYDLTNDRTEVQYPSGGIFMIKKDAWEALEGFDEGFINGGEDQDLFLRALQKKYKIGYSRIPVCHFLSQSRGRFDKIQHNDERFFKKWSKKKLEELFS